MNNYNYDWYYLNRNNNNLFNPKEGFEKGNMFTNLYSEYKNYNSINLVPKNEQEQKLFEIQAFCFAAHDLNLYLDTHPEDQSMFMLFQDYLKKEEKLVKEYETKYGPMMINSVMNANSFQWTENWPWEVKNV